MRTSRFTDSQIIAVLKEAEAGTPVPELCRTHGISNATFYKLHAKFGGMDASLMSRMKELEDENRRLKKLYVDAQLSAERWPSTRFRPSAPRSSMPVRRSPSAGRATGMSAHDPRSMPKSPTGSCG
jgi:putative transposase